MKKPLLFIACLLPFSAFAADAEDASLEEEKTFTMTGEFGLISTTGNTETTAFKGRLDAHQELRHWSNDYKLDALYKNETTEGSDGHDDTRTSAEKYFGSIQGNYKLNNPDHRLFSYASYEKDRFSSYEYQTTWALGWNHKMWDDDDSSFEYSLGPGYNWARTSEGEDRDSPILRGSLDYLYHISETATFQQAFSTEIGEYNTRSKSESAITAKIADPLSLKFSVTMDHNTKVDHGVDELDTQTAVTLLYTFF